MLFSSLLRSPFTSPRRPRPQRRPAPLFRPTLEGLERRDTPAVTTTTFSGTSTLIVPSGGSVTWSIPVSVRGTVLDADVRLGRFGGGVDFE
jgi:hypothetical protein